MPVTTAEELLRKGAAPRLDTVTMLSAQSGLIELLWPQAQGLDFLSLGLSRQTRPPLLLTSMLLCALIAAGLVFLYAPLELEKRRTAEIDRMIAAKREDVRKVEDLKKQVVSLAGEISTIQSFRRKKPMTVNLVREITSVLPNNAWLTRLRISETQADIEGFAGSATELIAKLEASKSLSKVELASATYRDQRMNADRFIIKADIEGAKKGENVGGGGHEKK
jgi:Tfp pilus assembly protein PilN